LVVRALLLLLAAAAAAAVAVAVGVGGVVVVVVVVSFHQSSRFNHSFIHLWQPIRINLTNVAK